MKLFNFSFLSRLNSTHLSTSCLLYFVECWKKNGFVVREQWASLIWRRKTVCIRNCSCYKGEKKKVAKNWYLLTLKILMIPKRIDWFFIFFFFFLCTLNIAENILNSFAVTVCANCKRCFEKSVVTFQGLLQNYLQIW